jgi:hypothetical protein
VIQNWDFDIVLPLPKIPCPVVGATGTITTSGDDVDCTGYPSVTIAATVTPPEDSCGSLGCNIDFAFDFVIPPPKIPCPKITAFASASLAISGIVYYMYSDSSNGSMSRSSSCADSPEVTVNVAASAYNIGTECNPSCVIDFDFDFDFVIPPPLVPCPEFTGVAAGGVTVIADDETPYVSIGMVVSKVGEGNRCDPYCDYEILFDFDFGIPGGSGAAIMHFTVNSHDCDTNELVVSPVYYSGGCGAPPGLSGGEYRVKLHCPTPFSEAELAASGKGVAIYTYDTSGCTRRWVEISHCAEVITC